MVFNSLIYNILSNALTNNKNTSILYSRSLSLQSIFTITFLIIIFNYFFFQKTLTLVNGLLYLNLNTIIFTTFLLLVLFGIILVTSFYPLKIIKYISKAIKQFKIAFEIQEYNVVKEEMFSSTLKTKSTKDSSKNLSEDESKDSSDNLFESLSEKLPVKRSDNLPSNFSKDSASVIDESLAKEDTITIESILQATREHYSILGYALVVQFIFIGSVSLLACNDLITMFMGIELQSYGLYILSSIYRNSESSTSAGLTYFLLGGLSSCIILLGQSFLYINSGLTNLDGLYLLQNIITSDKFMLEFFYSDLTSEFIVNQNYYYLGFQNYTLQLSYIILSVGFLFKISAAPFHSWSPGVYNAVPTVTTTFIAIIPKISILILFFDLVYSTWFSSNNTQNWYSWTTILLFSSFLSLIIGSILGLSQYNIKKLYAYSTISHVGFLLLGLSIHNTESIQAFIFYLIQYSLSNFNAFIILITIGYFYTYYHKKTQIKINKLSWIDYINDLKNLSPVEYTDKLKGFFYVNPFLSLSLAITLYSFIGIPPLVGFFAKQMILSSALDNGFIFISLIAILTSVISAVYYLYVIKHMFFEKNEYKLNNLFSKYFDFNAQDTQMSISFFLSILISLLTLMILSFIFIYTEIYNLITIISILIIY